MLKPACAQFLRFVKKYLLTLLTFYFMCSIMKLLNEVYEKHLIKNHGGENNAS